MATMAQRASGLRRTNRYQKDGGKVYVTAPDHGETDPMLVRPGSDPNRREQLRVLIVEDDRGVREDVSSRLARHGMVVAKLDGPDDIGPVLRRFRPHVIVLDDRFERSGVDFKAILPGLIGTFPGVGVVVTTAMDPAGFKKADDPLAWGAAGVIEKRTMLQGARLSDIVKEAAGLVND